MRLRPGVSAGSKSGLGRSELGAEAPAGFELARFCICAASGFELEFLAF